MKPRKFRKVPVVIEAMRLMPDPDGWLSVAVWIKQGGGSLMSSSEGLLISTLEGLMLAKPGDWVIRGVQGEFYPIKSDIFDATYESVE